MKSLKEWRKELEKIGFDVPKDGIAHGPDGASFGAKVDVIRFLNTFDPDESKFPRVKEHYKSSKFEVTIHKDLGATHPGTMSVNITSNYDEKELTDETDSEEIIDLVGAAVEGGLTIDKVAELGDWILEVAKEKAREIDRDISGGI